MALAIEPINLLMELKLPPLLKVVQRIAQVAEFKSLWMTRWDPKKPTTGGAEGRDAQGNYFRISWWMTRLKKRDEQKNVDCVMFHIDHEKANARYANYLPAADLNRGTWKNFAEAVGNRLRDVTDTRSADPLVGNDPSEQGYWTEDEDIRTESIERMNDELGANDD